MRATRGESSASPPGEKLQVFGGRYMLLRKLAEGGMAEVFLARTIGVAGFEKLVVVKRILGEHAQNAEYQRMFIDEARLAASMAHPNVVQVFDLGSSPDGYYLVMEYLAGQDLRATTRAARIARQYLGWDFCVRATIAACEGLYYAHTLVDQKGNPVRLVHRDVTPSNLFVTYDGTTKVLDFGIAKSEARLAKTQGGALKGKFQYMAPEQVKSEHLDGRADQFALGCVLYELLTCRRMFHQDNELAIMRAVLEGERPRVAKVRPDVPPELDELVAIATRIDPAQRFPSLQAMQHALTALLQQRGLSNQSSDLAPVMRSLFKDEYAAHTELLSQLPTASPEELEKLLASRGPAMVAPGSASGVGSNSGPSMPSFRPRHDDSSDRTSVVPPPGTSRIRKLLLTVVALALAVAVGAGYVLTRPPPVAALALSSTPPGATVFLDGTALQGTTPLHAQGLKPGSHELRFELSGHEPRATTVSLAAAEEPVPLALALTPSSAPVGTVTVMAMPRTVTLTLNGAPVEGAPPWKLDGLAADTPHALVASAEGYKTQTLEFSVKSGEVVPLQLSLTAIPRPAGPAPVPVAALTTPAPNPVSRGPVTVALSAPDPLVVSLRGKVVGTTPCTVTLAQGNATLGVKAAATAFSGTYSFPVTADTSSHAIALPTGKLAVDVTPWADVYLGDTKLGTTPLAPKPVPAGTYRVKLVNSELGAIKTVTVKVTAGKTAAVRETLGE